MPSTDNTAKAYPTVQKDSPLALASDLTLQESAFALSYMVDYNYRRASKEVGIVSSLGRKLSVDSRVRAYILKELKENQTHNMITESYIEQHYVRLMPMLMGDTSVPLVSNGAGHTDRVFNANAALTALRDMSKSTEFQRVDDSDNKVTVTVNIQNLVGQ